MTSIACGGKHTLLIAGITVINIAISETEGFQIEVKFIHLDGITMVNWDMVTLEVKYLDKDPLIKLHIVRSTIT